MRQCMQRMRSSLSDQDPQHHTLDALEEVEKCFLRLHVRLHYSRAVWKRRKNDTVVAFTLHRSDLFGNVALTVTI